MEFKLGDTVVMTAEHSGETCIATVIGYLNDRRTGICYLMKLPSHITLESYSFSDSIIPYNGTGRDTFKAWRSEEGAEFLKEYEKQDFNCIFHDNFQGDIVKVIGTDLESFWTDYFRKIAEAKIKTEIGL